MTALPAETSTSWAQSIGNDRLLFGMILAVREAALFAFGANLLMVLAAIVSIMLTVPGGRSRDGQGA